MLGLLFGTVCLIALVKVVRRTHFAYGRHGWGGACAHGYGYAADGLHGGPGGRFGRRPARSRFLRALFERLETTPGQEKVIVQAADDLWAALRAAGDKLRETRADFATVLRGDVVDEAAMADIFLRHDTVISETRRTAVEAIAKAHEALTEQQRGHVADFIERSGRGRPPFWM